MRSIAGAVTPQSIRWCGELLRVCSTGFVAGCISLMRMLVMCLTQIATQRLPTLRSRGVNFGHLSACEHKCGNRSSRRRHAGDFRPGGMRRSGHKLKRRGEPAKEDVARPGRRNGLRGGPAGDVFDDATPNARQTPREGADPAACLPGPCPDAPARAAQPLRGTSTVALPILATRQADRRGRKIVSRRISPARSQSLRTGRIIQAGPHAFATLRPRSAAAHRSFPWPGPGQCDGWRLRRRDETLQALWTCGRIIARRCVRRASGRRFSCDAASARPASAWPGSEPRQAGRMRPGARPCVPPASRGRRAAMT